MTVTTSYVAVPRSLWSKLRAAVAAEDLQLSKLATATEQRGSQWLLEPCGHKHAGGALSDREMQILVHVSRGATNEEIAGAVWLSIDTVKRHLHQAQRKLGARNRAHAVHIAHTLGLLGGRS